MCGGTLVRKVVVYPDSSKIVVHSRSRERRTTRVMAQGLFPLAQGKLACVSWILCRPQFGEFGLKQQA